MSRLIELTGVRQIQNTYAADGRKLHTDVKEGTQPAGGTKFYNGNLVFDSNGDLDYVLMPEGRITHNNGSFGYEYHLKDHLGSMRVAFIPGSPNTVVQTQAYYPFGATIAELSPNGTSDNRYGYNGKEKLDYFTGMLQYDYSARIYNPLTGRWGVIDPLAEKYPHISPYVYCANNPINRIDADGKEWNYVIGKNGHITINVELNFSIKGNFTAEQINAYKNAIATQFRSTISESSGGTMSGNIIFHEGNKNITQSLLLQSMGKSVGGASSYFQSSVNLYDSKGELGSLSNIGQTAVHEILHTLRLEHPFETTQTEDTKLLRVAPNSFVSTTTTDKNILHNIMSYFMITIDGSRSNNQTLLTRGQLAFMLNEINLQQQGFGTFQYNPNLSAEENLKLYKFYYENYWHNTPGTPVENQ